MWLFAIILVCNIVKGGLYSKMSLTCKCTGLFNLVTQLVVEWSDFDEICADGNLVPPAFHRRKSRQNPIILWRVVTKLRKLVHLHVSAPPILNNWVSMWLSVGQYNYLVWVSVFFFSRNLVKMFGENSKTSNGHNFLHKTRRKTNLPPLKKRRSFVF